MKSPAFQFYPSDFLIGTMGMSDAEVGIYIRMLCAQWLRGPLPSEPKTLKKLLNLDKKPPEIVLEKFRKNDDQTIQNERLEQEREKQIRFRESRVNNANARWRKECTSNARASGSICTDPCKTDALHSSSSDDTTENHSEPSSKKQSPKAKSKREPSADGVAFAEWFATTLETSATPQWKEKASLAYDDLVRLDKRDPQEIRRVCEWARTDPFWSKNFLSPLKLRKTDSNGLKYFDVFLSRMKTHTAPQPKPTPRL